MGWGGEGGRNGQGSGVKAASAQSPAQGLGRPWLVAEREETLHQMPFVSHQL